MVVAHRSSHPFAGRTDLPARLILRDWTVRCELRKMKNRRLSHDHYMSDNYVSLLETRGNVRAKIWRRAKRERYFWHDGLLSRGLEPNPTIACTSTREDAYAGSACRTIFGWSYLNLAWDIVLDLSRSALAAKQSSSFACRVRAIISPPSLGRPRTEAEQRRARNVS